jgi:hypothetical protein
LDHGRGIRGSDGVANARFTRGHKRRITKKAPELRAGRFLRSKSPAATR